MEIATLRQYLDDSYAAGVWLCGLGIVDVRRGQGNLVGMATAGVTLDLLAGIGCQLEEHLPGCAGSGHGPEQPGAICPRVAEPVGRGHAV